MQSIISIASDLSWPFAIALAWVTGEFGHRWTGLPRISFYGVVGFALAQTQLGVLPQVNSGPMLILADIAFGLILFELGYRINLRWLSNNPWIAVAGLVESIGTFAVVYLIAVEFKVATVSALLLAALSMSTSPATIMRVINEERSSGQVSERVMHMSALNCVLAVFTFNVIVGYRMFHSSGDLLEASMSSFTMLLASAAAGAIFGVVVPAMLRRLGNMAQDATVAFALSVILLVAVTYTTRLSPLLATLVFGLVARHRRIAFSQAQRNFGALGELLTVLLFVFAASTLAWPKVVAGAGLAVAIIAARCVTKIIGVGAFSHVSGISWRKGVLTGVALTPVSVSVVLLVEHARHRGVNFSDELNALAAFILILELLGPIVLQRALIWAKENHNEQER